MSTPTMPRSSRPHSASKIFLWCLLALMAAGPVLQKASLFPTQTMLALSLENLSKGYIWTLFTYLFASQPLSVFDAIFRVGIDLVLVWFLGKSLIERIGCKHFFMLVLGATLCGGALAAASMLFFDNSFFAGPSPLPLTFYLVWTILCTRKGLATFLPRTPWVLDLLIAVSLLLDLWVGKWPALFANLGGILFGYLFCVIAEKMCTVRFLRPFETKIHRRLEKLHPSKSLPNESKVIDFRTGKPILDDDQFMDAMLARISLYGEEILSPNEKSRMRQISEKKSMKK